MVNVELSDRELGLILNLIRGRVEYGVNIDLTKEYITIFDKLNAKKIGT